jgi:hypothetical protein
MKSSNAFCRGSRPHPPSPYKAKMPGKLAQEIVNFLALCLKAYPGWNIG